MTVCGNGMMSLRIASVQQLFISPSAMCQWHCTEHWSFWSKDSRSTEYNN